ncbi:NUDIX hydrolase [Ectobacillus ponti]|uniref:NUDIX domain-containing protein n=1 Tax=Ectobacillus ponti TaxID=2961894 RepID=A0AA41X534_9BACI|nr:NUDIX domain-containing protein [Ectobacillus ponti]MCP8968912.1 NUDIX domain-containing protein [Ectobacillus ponti]
MKELYTKKVYAYITREQDGREQLLVHAHRDFPEAGVQVPGGTVNPGETLEAALLREVYEEAGLHAVQVQRHVADELVHIREKSEYQKRHFYHITLTAVVRDEWEHVVTGDGEDTNLVFQYRWVDLQQTPPLSGRQGAYLHLLEHPHLLK